MSVLTMHNREQAVKVLVKQLLNICILHPRIKWAITLYNQHCLEVNPFKILGKSYFKVDI